MKKLETKTYSCVRCVSKVLLYFTTEQHQLKIVNGIALCIRLKKILFIHIFFSRTYSFSLSLSLFHHILAVLYFKDVVLSQKVIKITEKRQMAGTTTMEQQEKMLTRARKIIYELRKRNVENECSSSNVINSEILFLSTKFKRILMDNFYILFICCFFCVSARNANYPMYLWLFMASVYCNSLFYRRRHQCTFA